jgi:glycyl-tRNA synthetase alpha chain
MALSFQDLIFRLQEFWGRQGCVIQTPYDVEVGAGTMCPETFLRVLGPQPYRVAYVQPSRRPADGRYGDNPNRLFKHWQLQVILKPSPADIQDLYLKSLRHIGIDLRKHDIKFEEDNWESPTLGAWGIGWQVMLDGLEITQFTYFQQCGGMDLDPVPAELTYGLERIAAFLQDVDSVYDIAWNPPRRGAHPFSYRDVRHADELQFSVYSFERADVATLWQLFDLHEKECRRLLAEYGGTGLQLVQAQDKRRFPVLAAYDQVLKCSHLFNLLDSRGAISVTERVAVIGRVRELAVGVARTWLDQQHADVRRPCPAGSPSGRSPSEEAVVAD